MVLTKERKVLLGLLGSAGIILVVDRVMLSTPRGAHAANDLPAPAALPGDAIGSSPVASDTNPKETTDADSRSIAEWNERARRQLAEAGEAVESDPFVSTNHQTPNDGLLSVSLFTQQHRLTALLTAGDQSVAMVNGKPVRLGEEVSGYRLVRVDSRSALFVAGEVIVRLSLPGENRGDP